MTFISVRFSLQRRDIFKQEQMKAFKNSLAARRQAALLSIPCHTHHHRPQPPTPNTTIKGYRDNQSANSSLCCLMDAAMKDFMSP